MTAEDILMREHRDALTRMDPAQVRAVRRLVKAAADPDRRQAEALQHQISCEADRPYVASEVLDWMLG